MPDKKSEAFFVYIFCSRDNLKKVPKTKKEKKQINL